MQKSIHLVLILLVVAISSKAQGLQFGIKGGFLFAPAYLQSDNIDFQNTQKEAAIGFSSAVQASLSFKKHLRFGLEGGISQFKNYVKTDIILTKSNNYTVTEAGHYQVKQYHIAAVAEYDFGKSECIFLNIGAGYYKDQKSRFIDGLRYNFNDPNASPVTDLTGESHARDNALGAFIGAGVLPKITQHLRLVIEGRYTFLPPTTIGPDNILLNFHVLNLNLGLVYRLQD